MVAESNPARRLRRLFERSVATARGRTIAAAVVGVIALSSAGAAVPIAAAVQTADHRPVQSEPRDTATAPAEAAAADAGAVELHLSPAGAFVLDPAAASTVGVEIVNGSAELLSQGVIRLSTADESVGDADELDAWLSDDAATATAVGEAQTPGVVSGGTSQVLVSIPAGALDASAAITGLRAELLVDGVVVATNDAAFPSPRAAAGGAPGLALAYPLTVPDDTTGLIDAEQLEAWTAPDGLLTRQLDAVADRSVAIGIDPRIIVSIRVLGSTAPESAAAWLERLGSIGNIVFPLAYADADVAVQSQLGLPALLKPESFADVLDPADFLEGMPGVPTVSPSDPPVTGPASLGSGLQSLTQEATPTPTPTPGDVDGDGTVDEVPTTEQLLAWPYTRADIAWPADGTVASGDLAWLAAGGLTTSLLAPGNVEAPASAPDEGDEDGESDGGPLPPGNAASSVDGGTAIVADARLTAALRAAAAATSDAEWREAMGRLAAELAAYSAQDASASSLLASFARAGGANADRVGATVQALATLAWARPASLSDAIGAPPVARTLASSPEPDERRATVQRLIDSEAQTVSFATALTEPALLADPTRRDLLALLDAGWIRTPTDWQSASNDWLSAQVQTRAAISVVPSSTINVISRESGVPATIENTLPYAVTLEVDVAPSNGRLLVEGRQTVTVEPESRASVVVPVAAGVGSGEVVLTVSLYSTEGVEIGSPTYLSANVQADWEGVGAAVLATIVVLFFGIGIWRNIRRRRKARAAEANEAGANEAGANNTDTDTDTDASATDTATEPDAAAQKDQDPRDE
ncbi:DUF6049 family protein [Agromyces mediolanus]|uniref:DUF6049 family protein n=1 Tax=Agromyces mediolanus TaxID=41986 RepID=UPI003836C509